MPPVLGPCYCQGIFRPFPRPEKERVLAGTDPSFRLEALLSFCLSSFSESWQLWVMGIISVFLCLKFGPFAISPPGLLGGPKSRCHWWWHSLFAGPDNGLLQLWGSLKSWAPVGNLSSPSHLPRSVLFGVCWCRARRFSGCLSPNNFPRAAWPGGTSVCYVGLVVIRETLWEEMAP